MDLPVLPEGCISNILSFTSPIDVCRSSLVSKIFKSAAVSDAVWGKFLLPYDQEIISRSVSPFPVVFSSKKDLYLHLCDHPILIDGGNKSFALEKWSGRKCYMVAARELVIVWGDTPQFSEVAELHFVCWLEIHGKMDTRMLSVKTTYAAYLVFKFREGINGRHFPPLEVSVRFVRGGGGGWHTVYMDPDYQEQVGQIRISTSLIRRFPELTNCVERKRQFLRDRGDGWMEMEMGEFFNDRGDDGDVEMSLMEVDDYKWKSGLIIQGIELRQKEG
ncbi:hypothetical protein HHK36_022351 [Tetracentron sinense]|uniref:F-box domain-containing protein n=1 Tax=Tetracentron sinense TaxID=13715 RepID=A0A835D6P8_TETSI|nr:hypothetical protein HHK36_022351 [Tetracentron sinense]